MNKKYKYSIYTPKEISNKLVDLALNRYFLGEYTEKKLNDLKLADLSCGTGILLMSALIRLLELSKKISGNYYYKETWITAYDIDLNAVEKCKENLYKILASYGIEANINIQLKNSLKIENEKFNIIIANPPYLGEKNNKELFDEIKKTDFGKNYYEARMDYFYFFIEKSIELLEKDGLISYLTTNYWLKANGASKLRNVLKTKGAFLYIEDYNESIFEEALGQHNMIFLWQKNLSIDELTAIKLPNQDIFNEKNINIYNENSKIILMNKKDASIIASIKEKANYLLSDLININQGIVSGCDKAFVHKEYIEEFSDYLKPFYKNKDIYKYSVKEKADYWILYIKNTDNIDKNIKEFLYKHYDKLSKRREVQLGSMNWWELQWPRDEKIFKAKKILVRQRSKENWFAYTEKELYGSADIYYLTAKNENISLLYILAYLNSELFFKWYKHNGKIKGRVYEFYSTPLYETPIYYPNNTEEILYIEKLVKKQLDNYSDCIEKEINRFFKNNFLLKYV